MTKTDLDPGDAIAGEALHHDSALLHVSGEALYTDDIPLPANALHAAFGLSKPAHARILALNLDKVIAAPGVVAVATAADVPGENSCGPILADEPIFADGLVQHAGQSLFAVAADSMDAARRAARAAHIEYEELPPILDIRTAIAQKSFVIPTQRLVRGDPQTELPDSTHRRTGPATLD